MANPTTYARLRATLRTCRAAAAAEADPRSLAADRSWLRGPLSALAVAGAAGRDLLSGELTLRAMSLVYTTLLSLVPLLAISFSMLKALGIHNRVEPLLAELLEPLGAQGREITQRIIDFVDNIEVGVLGFLGVLLLLYTVISLLQKIEQALNYIWQVTRTRNFIQKVRDYLAAVVIGPVLIVAGTGAIGALMSSAVVQSVTEIGPIGELVAFAGRFTSFVLIVGAFTFLYVFLPNTRVRLAPALVGGITAGLLWSLAGWAFGTFIAGATKYTAVYSAFATLIFFMIWLHLVWLIVLMGSSVAYYVQNPHAMGVRRDNPRYAIALIETAALAALYHILQAWYAGEKAPDASALNAKTRLPMPLLNDVLGCLERAGLLERTDWGAGGYRPGRPPEATPLKRALDAVRSDAGGGHPPVSAPETPEAVQAATATIEAALRERLETLTLADFARTAPSENRGGQSPLTPLHDTAAKDA